MQANRVDKIIMIKQKGYETERTKESAMEARKNLVPGMAKP